MTVNGTPYPPICWTTRLLSWPFDATPNRVTFVVTAVLPAC
jgi:hypothetical protein